MWFIYTRVHNVNRKEPDDDDSPPKKIRRKEKLLKHAYPDIPAFADDEESTIRNMKSLKEEIKRHKPSKENVRTLMARTFPYRRKSMLESEVSVSEYVKDLPLFKNYEYVSMYYIVYKIMYAFNCYYYRNNGDCCRN